MAEAADLRGINTIMLDFFDDPPFVRDLFEFVVEMELRFAKAQVQAGVDLIDMNMGNPSDPPEDFVVEKLADEVCCTVTVSPLFTVPSALVYDPPLMAYWPPVIEMDTAVVIPVTVIVFEVIIVLRATPV